MHRTLSDLTNAVAAKCAIDPVRVVRTIHVHSGGKGLMVVLDDEGVAEIPEGQDMRVEVVKVGERDGGGRSVSPKREWDGAGDGVGGDVNGEVDGMGDEGQLELRLEF